VILRDATISTERVRVGAATEPLSIVSLSPDSSGAPVLSVERVIVWLRSQPTGVREAIAIELCDTLAEVTESATAAGFEQGRADGAAQVRSEHAAWLESLEGVRDRVDASCEAAAADLESGCVEIVADALTRIAPALVRDSAVTVSAVRAALAAVAAQRHVRVGVHADDCEAILAERDALTKALGLESLEIVPDARVELGGCIVRTQYGEQDQRFEVLLSRLFAALQSARTKERVRE
jgi:flagellar biosynthesis/type III secretory pathway protein FliH